MKSYKASGDTSAEVSDHELIERAGNGDSDAYAELWVRHYGSGIRAAKAISSTLEPDDLVQEAYTRIYRSMQRGDGPKQAFRPYLYAAIRNTAATWGQKSRRELPRELMGDLEDPRFNEGVAEAELDATFAVAAYRELPARWKEVLWYLEIEDLKPAEAAKLMGMSAHATSQLALRAREGLRDAWVSSHAFGPNMAEECLWVSQRLGKYSRSRSSNRESNRIEVHLASCERCVHAASQLHDVAGKLRSSALLVVLGSSAATGFLTVFSPGSPQASATAAVSAMPSAVVGGPLTASVSVATGVKTAVTFGLAVLGASLWIVTAPSDVAKNEVTKPPLPTSTAEVARAEPPIKGQIAEDKNQLPAPQPTSATAGEPVPGLPVEQVQEQQHEQESDAVTENLGLPPVWNSSRNSEADSRYAVTIMLGGRDNAEVVALLDGVEVARGEGNAPQLGFTVTPEQYASANLQFAYVVEGKHGPLTEARTPAEWCGSPA